MRLVRRRGSASKRGSGPECRSMTAWYSLAATSSRNDRIRFVRWNPGAATSRGSSPPRHDVQPDVVDHRLREPACDLADERIARLGRQPLEVAAQDHRPQERLEGLARL